MKKGIIFLLFFLYISLFIVACGSNNEETDTGLNNNNSGITTEENEQNSEGSSDEDTEQDEAILPEEVPADFPFPDGANFNVTTDEGAARISYIVGFSFTDDPDTVYENFKEYVTNNGYTISTDEDYRFVSVKGAEGGISATITVNSSVNVATVTFSFTKN